MPSEERDPAVWVLGPVIAPADLPGLVDLVRATDATVVICDVAAVTRPDVDTVDTLARLQLAARRLGRRICLRRAGAPLRDLVTLVGLADVLPLHCGPAEPRWQAEEREQPLGVEERVDPGDLPA